LSFGRDAAVFRLRSQTRPQPSVKVPRISVREVADRTCATRDHWDHVCDDAPLNVGKRDILWNGAFFKHYAFEGLSPDMAGL